MDNREKMIKLLLSIGAMVIVIVISITAKRTNQEKNQTAHRVTISDEAGMITSEFEEQYLTIQNEKEPMTQAPTDVSNWEIHSAADNEPDTGGTIQN